MADDNKIENKVYIPDAILSPMQKIAMKTPEQELEHKAELQNELNSLDALTKSLNEKMLTEKREEMMLTSRLKDIEYVNKMDELISIILDVLTEDGVKDKLRAGITKALEKGDMKQLKELMVAFAIPVDKREQLLGFDSTRTGDNKKKAKISFMFSGSNGEKCAGQVEVDQ